MSQGLFWYNLLCTAYSVTVPDHGIIESEARISVPTIVLYLRYPHITHRGKNF